MGSKKKRDYKIIGEFEMEGEEAEKINKMIEEADKEIEEARVYFRWGTKQLQLVKKAAELMGIPYQTYIKAVLFKQSIEDIKIAEDSFAKF